MLEVMDVIRGHLKECRNLGLAFHRQRVTVKGWVSSKEKAKEITLKLRRLLGDRVRVRLYF